MNWDALGAIGEVVGAVAVVLTLGYLAIQIRQSGKSSRQQSYHDLVTRRSEFYNKMVESNDVAAIFIAGCRGDSMNEIDAQRFTSASLNYVSHFQDVYLQRKNEVIEESVWLAERQFLAVVMGLPGFVEWWQAATQYFLPEFVREVGTFDPIPVVVMDQKTGRWTRGTW
jgi:hypothetical protein